MTLDEAIKHSEEVADKKKREKQKWNKWLESDYDHRAVAEKVSCELCAEEHRQLAEWLKELKQLREQASWIPVSEGFPKENKTVIASTKYGVYPEARYTKEYGWKWAYEAGADYWRELEDVTAWMPLPARFEPRESEDNFDTEPLFEHGEKSV